MSEPTMCMPVEQCRELLVELQHLRVRIAALEQVVATAVNEVEHAEHACTKQDR